MLFNLLSDGNLAMEALIAHQKVLINHINKHLGPVLDSYIKYVTLKPMLAAVLDNILPHLDLSVAYSHIKSNSSKEFVKSYTNQALDMEIIYSMMFKKYKKHHCKAKKQFRTRMEGSLK